MVLRRQLRLALTIWFQIVVRVAVTVIRDVYLRGRQVKIRRIRQWNRERYRKTLAERKRLEMHAALQLINTEYLRGASDCKPRWS